jgi:uncharacterized protein YPO0396
MTYLTEDQYDRWKDRAEEFDMSVSEFMQAMVEAGFKKFDATVEPDQSNQELREQRNDLNPELDRARERIRSLEDRLHDDERAAVERYVENNPGATFGDITQKIGDTVPKRVNSHLEELEGDSLTKEGDAYYPVDNDSQGGDGR